jgi:methylglutaconyl-CoA hydratase
VHRVLHPDPKLPRQMDEENAALIARLRVSKEGSEGLRAFLDKRRPVWIEGAARGAP